MPRRYLSPSVSRDKLLNRIAQRSEFAALVYLMALPHAADDCALPTNDPEELLMVVCPARRDKQPDDMAEAMAVLTGERDDEGHTLLEYGPDGRLRYPPGSFYRHQSYISEQKRPPADTPPDAPTGRTVSAPSITNAPGPAKSAGTGEKLGKQQNAGEISASFTVSPSLSLYVPPVPHVPPPVSRAGTRGGAPSRIGDLTSALAGRSNAARERGVNGNVRDAPAPNGGMTDDQLWRRFPYVAHYVLDAEQKLGDRHSRRFFVQLAMALYERRALEAIWPRSVGLAHEQRGARNRGALFVETVRRLCAEAQVDLGEWAQRRKAAVAAGAA